MLQVLKEIITRLSSLPTVVYGSCYLSLIPIFGIIYSLLPYGFYHSTAIEEPYYQDLKKEAEISIQNFLYSQVSNNSSEECTDLENNYINISVEDIIYDNKINSIIFDVCVYVSRGNLIENDSISIIGIMQLNVSMPMEIENKVKILPNIFIYQNLTPLRIRQIQNIGNLTCLNEELIFGKANGEKYLVTFPQNVHMKINDLVLASNGRPIDLKRNIFRMMYFSTVTITTLGYGDIVPVTSLARFFVFLESIIGIILIGLFINSVKQN